MTGGGSAGGEPVELLVLDVNGVLYRYDVDRRVAALADRLDRSPDEVRAAVFDSGIEDRADAGELAPGDYLRAISDELGTELDRATWTAALAGAVTPNEPVLELLAGLAGAVAMATLSNNGLLVEEQVDSIYPRLRELGIAVHVAAEFGDSKPERDVYLDVCERHGVDPGRAAFVDDKARNVEGAERAGLRAHRFEGVDGLRRFLGELGLAAGGRRAGTEPTEPTPGPRRRSD